MNGSDMTKNEIEYRELDAIALNIATNVGDPKRTRGLILNGDFMHYRCS